MRAQAAGDDEQTAGVLVQTMHDAAARQLRRFREMVQQGVEQGAVRVARSGMDDQPGRLVNDDDVGVGVDDGQRDVLRLGVILRFHGNPRTDAVARIDHVPGAGGVAVELYQSALDACLPAAARIFRVNAGEILVKSPAAHGVVGDTRKRLVFCGHRL